MIEPNILVLALGGTLILWHRLKLKKEDQAFRKWVKKDREADAAFRLAYTLHEAGAQKNNPVFKKATRKWHLLQKESQNLLHALSPP